MNDTPSGVPRWAVWAIVLVALLAVGLFTLSALIQMQTANRRAEIDRDAAIIRGR